MAEQAGEQQRCSNCDKCSRLIQSRNKATQLHADKTCKALHEQLQEERQESKRKVQKLEDEKSWLEQELEEKARKIRKLEDDILLLKGKVSTNEFYIKEFLKKGSVKRLKADADTAMLEEKLLRQRPATVKDIEELFTSMFKSHYTSLKEDQVVFERILLSKLDKDHKSYKERDELYQRIRILEQQITDLQCALKESDKKCQEYAQKYQRMKQDWKTLNANVKDKEEEIKRYINILSQENEALRQKIHDAQLRECPTCSVLKDRVEQLEVALKVQPTQREQPQIEDGLEFEYEKVVKSCKLLEEVEGCFKDTFYAKGFISDIFMDAYDKCKNCLMDILCKNIDELFKVQTEEDRFCDMEDLCHAFGLLLQTTGVKLMVTKTEVLPDIVKQVKESVPKLKTVKWTKYDLKSIIEKVPFDQFVQLAWKFVTQPYPVIISTPKMMNFDDTLHKSSFQHWSEDEGKRPLIYVQPVVYRSYHGEVLVKGVVGNLH